MNSFIIVVPTYNNFHTIQDVVNDILSYDYKIIVVDDGSSTELTKILEESPNLTIVRHATNMGKGQAIISGAKKLES